jgi:hypothetical protein
MIGQSLEQMRKDLRLMPTQALMEYKKNPSKQAIDGMPLDMLAGLELSRRAQLQQEQMAKMAPNPQQMPTVVDQAAMGLAGMAQQPTPQMPGVPAQFQSSAPPPPPQAAPQGAPQAAPPQQMAQAPQPPAQPMQPTQQQPQKLAAGGIASLGDMQMQRNQQPPSPLDTSGAGQPLMLARGGIVAFQNNPNQPVSADMPSEEEEPTSTAGNFFRGIRDFVKRQQAESQATQQRIREANQLKREINQTKPGLFEALTPTQRAEREKEVKVLQGYRDMGKTTPTPTAAPAPDAFKGVDPTDIMIEKGGRGQPDFAALLRQAAGSGGGGGSNLNLADLRREIAEAKKPTEQEIAYQNLVQEQMNAIRNRQSPEVSEAERKRIIDEQFRQNQAMSKPYYDQMKAMLDEERAATKARYADKDADAMIRAGLRGLSSRKPGMTGFFEGVGEGLDYHDKVSELEANANKANRQANMDLMKSRMSDEKGDREAAQRYFDSYQKNKRDAETYELQRSNILINVQKGLVDVEGKRERAGTAMQLGVERLGSQMENNSLRNQLGLAQLAARMQGQGPKPMTINERIAVEKRADELFSNPRSDAFQKYVGAIPNGQQLLADLKNGRLKPDDPKFQAIVNLAKKRYTQEFLGGTNRSSSSVTPYDQATAELGQ